MYAFTVFVCLPTVIVDPLRVRSPERRKIAKARRFLLFLLPFYSPTSRQRAVQLFSTIVCKTQQRNSNKSGFAPGLVWPGRPELHVNLIKFFSSLWISPLALALPFVNCHCFCTVIVSFFFCCWFALCALSHCATQCSFFVFIHRDKVGRQPRMEVVIVSTLCGVIRRSPGK